MFDTSLDYEEVLRLGHEPCVHFSERQVHELLAENCVKFMDLLERFYLHWKNHEDTITLPLKSVFNGNGTKGDLRVMPCIIDNFENDTIKCVKVIGTNEEESVVKDKICVGKALLVHPLDNFVQATFDVCSLSSFRTAAISVLAYKHLISESNGKIGIIGAGRIGIYTAYILSRWMGIRHVSVTDVKPDHLERFKKTLGHKWLDNIDVKPLDPLLQEASEVFLCTTSSEPILHMDNAGHLGFISSVGADADNLSEVDHSLASDYLLVSDSKQNVHFGDLKRFFELGYLTSEKLIELKDIFGKKVNSQKILFISTGIAVQDAIVCHFLFKETHVR